jgi:hypothetical protein
MMLLLTAVAWLFTLAWTALGLAIFNFWYIGAEKPAQWKVWLVALFCGPGATGVVVSIRWNGDKL